MDLSKWSIPKIYFILLFTATVEASDLKFCWLYSLNLGSTRSILTSTFKTKVFAVLGF